MYCNGQLDGLCKEHCPGTLNLFYVDKRHRAYILRFKCLEAQLLEQ